MSRVACRRAWVTCYSAREAVAYIHIGYTPGVLDRSSYRSYHRSVKVGTKQLKNQLSLYLRRVKAGEVVTVTDRGKAVAELRGIAPAKSNEALVLRDLDAVGLVTIGSGKFRTFRPTCLRGGASASKAISEDRGP